MPTPHAARDCDLALSKRQAPPHTCMYAYALSDSEDYPTITWLCISICLILVSS